MSITNQEEANKVISDKLEEARKLIKECETIADEHGCWFSFQVAYGMGGSYEPKPKKVDHSDDPEWVDSSNEDDYGWQSSSANC